MISLHLSLIAVLIISYSVIGNHNAILSGWWNMTP